jgi:hypothetical protein
MECAGKQQEALAEAMEAYLKVSTPSVMLSLLQQNAELKAERDALAAETAYLRDEIKQHSECTHFCEVCGKDDQCKTDDVCRVLSHPLPATNAAMAEWKATGVEEFVSWMGQDCQSLKFGSAQWKTAKSVVMRAISFAAIMRKGGE